MQHLSSLQSLPSNLSLTAAMAARGDGDSSFTQDVNVLVHEDQKPIKNNTPIDLAAFCGELEDTIEGQLKIKIEIKGKKTEVSIKENGENIKVEIEEIGGKLKTHKSYPVLRRLLPNQPLEIRMKSIVPKIKEWLISKPEGLIIDRVIELKTGRSFNEHLQKAVPILIEYLRSVSWLAGQSNTFYQQIGTTVIKIGKQYLAGHIAVHWSKTTTPLLVTRIIEKTKTTLPVALVTLVVDRIAQKILTDLRNHITVKSEVNYLLNTATIAHTLCIELIETFNPHLLIRKNYNEGAELLLFESLRAMILTALSSRPILQLLGRLVNTSLSQPSLPIAGELIKQQLSITLGPNSELSEITLNTIFSDAIDTTLIQLQQELFAAVKAEDAEALTSVLEKIAKDFICTYLATPQNPTKQHTIPNYIDFLLNQLPNDILRAVTKQIEAILKKEIIIYSQTADNINNIASQLLKAGQQLIRGYIAQKGWGTINTLVQHKLDTWETPQLNAEGTHNAIQAAKRQTIEKIWAQFTIEFDAMLKILDKRPNSLLDTGDIIRAAFFSLLTRVDLGVLLYKTPLAENTEPQPIESTGYQARKNKLLLLESIKTLILTSLYSPTILKLLGRLIYGQLSPDHLPILREYIKSLFPLSYLDEPLLTDIIETTLTQLKQELPEALEDDRPETLKRALETRLQQLIRDLSASDIIDMYVKMGFEHLSVTILPIVLPIWEVLNPEIVSYGQSAKNTNTVVDQLFSAGQQFIQGYISHMGWDAIDALVQKKLDGWEKENPNTDSNPNAANSLKNPLFQQMWENLKIEFEVFFNVAAKPHNYLLNTATTLRTAFSSLVRRINLTALFIEAQHAANPQSQDGEIIGNQAQTDKLLLWESLKILTLTVLYSPAILKLLGRLMHGQLSQDHLSRLKDAIKKWLVISGLNDDLLNIIKEKMLAQLRQELYEVAQDDNTEVLKTELEIGLKQLIGSLNPSQWDMIDRYIQGVLYQQLTVDILPIALQLWESLKPEILAYSQSTQNTGTLVDQLLSIGQQFVSGYINQMGWEAIDIFISQALDHWEEPPLNADSSRDPVQIAKRQLIEKTWVQLKIELEKILCIDRQNPDAVPFISNGLVNLESIAAQLIHQPNVAHSLTQANMSQTARLLIRLFSKATVTEKSAWFSLANASTILLNTSKNIGLKVLRFYLAAQDFTTLKAFVIRPRQVEHIAPAAIQAQQQKLTLSKIIFNQLKSQLMTELFGSQEEFKAQRIHNKGHLAAALMESTLRKQLSLPKRPQSLATFHWLMTGISANTPFITLGTSLAVSAICAVDVSKIWRILQTTMGQPKYS